ncbi:MAG TPA: dihydrofolate reductase family protein [Propionibacteriaceae bacterium]|nr:dihydrofolate reductase family protein [Propionibacteriaceae bacterium]
MSRVRLHNFSISLDGFGTGEGLTDEQPFGHADGRLHQWMFRTAMWGRIMGESGGSEGVDNDFAEQAWQGFGAEIMGRRKFHVGTGPIPADWDGFWGSDPPFHTPVIVLTHHTRPSLTMEGGTTFHFRDVSPQEAVDEARELAGGLDVRLGGGVETVRAFLEADLVDHLHVVVVPILLGRGQRLWDGLEGLESRFDLRLVAGEGNVVHVVGDRR